MTEKTPDFVERVQDKFMPKVYYHAERGSYGDSYRTAYYPRMSIEDAERFGLQDEPISSYGVSNAKGFHFGQLNGVTVKWTRRYDSEYYGNLCFHDHTPSLTLTLTDWKFCRDFHKQKLKYFSEHLKRSEYEEYEELKKDVSDLEAYVRYLEKGKGREGLKGRLKNHSSNETKISNLQRARNL